jgi:hypothetical protein
MIKYLQNTNISLIEKFVSETVQTINYQVDNDQSDQDDYIERQFEKINPNLYNICIQQLKILNNPIIIYSNYRKLFNKTLEKYYKEQVCLISIHSRLFFFFSFQRIILD